MINKNTIDEIVATLKRLEKIEHGYCLKNPSSYHSGKELGYHTSIDVIQKKIKEAESGEEPPKTGGINIDIFVRR